MPPCIVDLLLFINVTPNRWTYFDTNFCFVQIIIPFVSCEFVFNDAFFITNWFFAWAHWHYARKFKLFFTKHEFHGIKIWCTLPHGRSNFLVDNLCKSMNWFSKLASHSNCCFELVCFQRQQILMSNCTEENNCGSFVFTAIFTVVNLKANQIWQIFTNFFIRFEFAIFSLVY